MIVHIAVAGNPGSAVDGLIGDDASVRGNNDSMACFMAFFRI